jgi:hypothetical protein
VIPDAALLQPEDLAGPRTSPAGTRPFAPPRPCAEPGYPSDGALLGSTAVEVYYRAPGVPADYIPTTTIQEYVALYRADGAARFLADLNAALVRCPGTTSPWRVVDRGLAGEESILIRVGPTNTGHAMVDQYIAVARSGRVVVVVADLGWEDTVDTTERVRSLIPVALRRASTISR